MTTIATDQGQLFDPALALPRGLEFAPAFVSCDEEAELLQLVSGLPLREARFRQYTAQRRVHAWRDEVGDDDAPAARLDALPPPLAALRGRLAAWAGVAAHDFVHVLVSEYRRGTPLGWHRDAPIYELIVGVSLGAPARLRLRPWPPRSPQKADIVALDLAPRSAYLLRGAARWGWQHSLPPLAALRHSITMRTRRR